MTHHLTKWREENPEAAEEQARKSQEALKAWREAGGTRKNPLEKTSRKSKVLTPSHQR